MGTFSRGFAQDRSQYGIWTTKATAGAKAGFRTEAVLTSRAMDFTFQCNFKITSAEAVNFYIGLVDDAPATFLDTGTAADPLNNLDGIGISLHEGNIKVAHNDVSITESEVTVFDDFIEPVLFESRVYNLTIQSTNSTDGNVTASIASPIDDPSPITSTSVTLSSSLPNISQTLELQVFVETTTTETKSIEVYNCTGSF